MQSVPPVLAPEHAGAPPSAVEQKDEQMPVPTTRQLLPFTQSLALVQASPGCLFPLVGAHTAPFVPK